MRTCAATAGLAAAILVMSWVPAWTAPKPADIPVSWELELYRPGALQTIQVRVYPNEPLKTYWYLRYSVTNQTGQDRIFTPEFDLVTETGQMLHAGKAPAAVFEAIKKLHNDPLMLDMTGMTGKLLQGEDNAKVGVAIWPDFDPQAGAVDLFVGGLSGETVELTLPTPVEVTETDVKTGEQKTVAKDKVVLSKTLHLRYSIPGEASSRLRAPVRLEKKEWVMR